jgi:ABC-2 type transport system permease protein
VSQISDKGPFVRWPWLVDAYYLNPMAGVSVSMQRALYGAGHTYGAPPTPVLPDPGYLFYVEKLAVGAIPSLLILALGLYVYHRMSADFAEEL